MTSMNNLTLFLLLLGGFTVSGQDMTLDVAKAYYEESILSSAQKTIVMQLNPQFYWDANTVQKKSNGQTVLLVPIKAENIYSRFTSNKVFPFDYGNHAIFYYGPNDTVQSFWITKIFPTVITEAGQQLDVHDLSRYFIIRDLKGNIISIIPGNGGSSKSTELLKLVYWKYNLKTNKYEKALDENISLQKYLSKNMEILKSAEFENVKAD